jgi:hypothetical protein
VETVQEEPYNYSCSRSETAAIVINEARFDNKGAEDTGKGMEGYRKTWLTVANGSVAVVLYHLLLIGFLSSD